MGELINLNRARKKRATAQKAASADANRVRFGRTRAQREAENAEQARRDELLDGARREE